MSDPEKPGLVEALRREMNAARKDRAFLRERRRWEKEQKAAAREQSLSRFLDLPGVWLERRWAEKRRQEEDQRYASLGAASPSPQTAAKRVGKAFRNGFERISEDRELLWRRIAGALGVIAAALLAASLLIYFRLTPTRPLVTVGNRVIQRGEYQAELDAVAGKPVLTKMVYAELVRQAAAKAGLTPTPAQIDARLAEIERHGTPLPEGMDAASIQERMSLTLALENLRTQGIQATDAEIADFYRKNAALLVQPARVQSILVLTRTEFEAAATAGLLAKGKTAAEIAAQPDRQVDGENGFHLNQVALTLSQRRKTRETALAMHSGQIITLPFGNAFLTIKCLRNSQPTLPPLPQIREEIAAMIKLGKAPSTEVELARLYQANRPSFDMDRYSVYFDDIAHPNLSAPPASSQPGAAP